jgi:hypothetical protein
VTGRGAYGLKLSGVPGVRDALVPAPHTWPSVSVKFVRGAGDGAITDDGDFATVGLPWGGEARLDRAARTAILANPQPVSDDFFLHPTLAYVASVFSGWMGRCRFHAGAFVGATGAWGVLGGHEAGKSSTLGWLARTGHPVLADDMLVLDGTTAFAGPRAIDFRPATAGLPAFQDGVKSVRGGQRSRYVTAPAGPEYPLRGWFVLSWGGEEVATRTLGAGEHLRALVDNLHPVGSADETALFDLLRLPAYEVTRPRDLSTLAPTAAEMARIARPV